MKQIVDVWKRNILSIKQGTRIHKSDHELHYGEPSLFNTSETITSYNELVQRDIFTTQSSKSFRDKLEYGDCFSYAFFHIVETKFGIKNFISYTIETICTIETNYTLQELMNKLPADEMIEYLKDNGLNVCPVAK